MTDMRPGRRRVAAMLALGTAWGLLPAIPRSATRKPARPVVDARRHGARGDGVADDTGALQEAIDRLAGTGGVVEVPAGHYLIDPLRSVRMRSRVDLRLAPGARLVAKPNAAPRAYVLFADRVTDVEISGGEILGERDSHQGTKGEWGHGLMIRGSSRVTVRNLRISRCWGDGISIGAAPPPKGAPRTEAVPSTDIRLEGVTCRGNRRQGLTIGRSRRVVVVGCEFSDTHGTKPEYGIDIEPDKPGTTHDVRIERCTLRGNRGGGIQLYLRVSGVTIRDCTIEANGFGIYTVGASDGVIVGNRIGGHRHAGVAIRKGSRNFRVERNRFDGNNRRMRLSAAVANSARGHVQVGEGTHGIAVGANDYD